MRNKDIWTPFAADIGRRVGEDLRAGNKEKSSFERRLYLPRVLAIGPGELDDPGEEAARRIVRRLAAALRSERTRGRAGHWTYDLNRHVALIQAYKAERRRLVQLAGAGSVRE
jgi:hypothetical protein